MNSRCPICRRHVAPGSLHYWKYLRNPEPASSSAAPAAAPDEFATPRSSNPSPARERPSHLPPNRYLPVGRCTPDGSFLVQTQLPDGRMAIIVDPGAWTNLAGGKWVRDLCRRAKTHAKEAKQEKLHRPLEVQGVGRGTQSANWTTKIPIAVLNKEGTFIEQIFEVPTLEGEDGADVPALLGLRSMRAKDAVLEMAGGKECLTFPGPGGYTIEWSPGTVHLPLEVAPSGHYVIPCDGYANLSQPEAGGLVEEQTVLMADLDEYRAHGTPWSPPPPPPPPSRH